jgi:hypothetical protein
MHWHPNTDEWQCYIEGQARMSVFAAAGQARTFDFMAGDVGYVPFAMGHYIENTGNTRLRFLEIFKSSYYAAVSLNQWMALTPPELVEAHLNLDKQVGRAAKREGARRPCLIHAQSQLTQEADDLQRCGSRRSFQPFMRPWCAWCKLPTLRTCDSPRHASHRHSRRFPVRVRQAVTTAMARQANTRQLVAMRIMSACAPRSRPESDEVIRSGIHVDMTHVRIGHGAARVVGREPTHDRSFAAQRGVEINRSPVAMHRGMVGACDHGAGPARRDNLHRAKCGLDPVQQLACLRIQARSGNADAIIRMVKA